MVKIGMNETLDLDSHEGGQKFLWADYLSFCTMLALSALIGIYFGFCDRKTDSTNEYSHGGNDMSIWPITASLTVSLISAVTILGVPSEVYMYGTLMWWICVSSLIAGLLNDFFYLPVFYELRLTSCYEYLDLRFGRSVRLMASLLNSLQVLLYSPIVIYVPALVVSQVSALDINLVTPVISVICIAYTVLGGIKAVVWTDFLQAVVILGSTITVTILGISHVGGFQTMSLHLFMFGMFLVYTITTLLGLVLYAEYYDCDLLKSKKISKADQMITYYVMKISSYMPGLPGLFVAGVVSAALSTLSSSLNSISITLFEDFLRPWFKNGVTDKRASYFMKLIVIVFGALSIGLSFIVSKLGLIIQLATSINGVTIGNLLGLFTLGMFFPRANYKGALAGGIISLGITMWLVMGAQIAIAEHKIKYETLPTTAVGCGYNNTAPDKLMSNGEEDDDVFVLYKISFTYFSVLGFLLVIIIGMAVSYFTEPPHREHLRPDLFTPVIRKCVKRLVSFSAKKTEFKTYKSSKRAIYLICLCRYGCLDFNPAHHIGSHPNLFCNSTISKSTACHSVAKQDSFTKMRLEKTCERMKEFNSMYVGWIGSTPVLNTARPEHAEVLLGSTKNLDKSFMYKFLYPWLGTGLLTSTGKKWHSHRKMITPTFHFKILENFVEVFAEKSEILVKKLQKEVGSEGFDVYPYITKCALDIICETAMGIVVNAQENEGSSYVAAIYDLSDAILHRIIHPWLHPQVVFDLTSKGAKFKECLKMVHDFTNKVIKEKKTLHSKKTKAKVQTHEDDLGRKERVAFLDMLLEASENGTKLTDDEIREEVDTFMFEGHDTTSVAMCWTLFLLGLHPQIQEEVQEELDNIFQGSNRSPTLQDLNEMKCLERVIKETLRLYPSVPGFGRILSEDTQLGTYTIPAGTTVNLHVHYLHRNPEYFPDPEKFDPDRFLPERVVNRHPYAYIPFSAGPRNCIGQKFAILEEKAVLSHVLRTYKVRSLEKFYLSLHQLATQTVVSNVYSENTPYNGE
ncbi:hypothetical protein C0J52_17230 [Blattella germanica]|nr:hypothetical protein C0J52_17230 [Blattella germanica]